MNGTKVRRSEVILRQSDGYDLSLETWCCGKSLNALVISHGMKEYALRYDEVACFFVQRGFAVFAFDHRGHGKAAESRGELGFLAEESGFCRVVEDLREVVRYVKRCCPNGKVALLGHSFGSFVAQGYIEKYGDEIDVCLLSGSAGPRALLVGAGRGLAWMFRLFCGKRFRSTLMEWAVFGNYNKRIKKPKSKNSWLCSDDEVVEQYDSDVLCSFVPTLSFFCDLFCGLSMIHKKKNMMNIPKELPILIFSGEEDPVGGYGSSVRELYKCYRKIGIEKAELKLYGGGRHEMLNEKCKFEVCEDMLRFIEEKV